MGQPLTPTEQLLALPLEELARRADELEARLPPLSVVDSDWLRYETRRRLWADFKTEQAAIRLRGEQIGRIHTYQRLLHRAETPAEELHCHSLEYLTARANALELWFAR